MPGLSLGTGLGLSRGRGGVPAWSPAALFAAGEKGLWIDPSHLASLSSDDAGTTPATVDGVVGSALDRSGNSYTMLQATGSRKPILRQSSDLYYLEHDGVDDGLANAAGKTWAATSDIFIALRPDAGEETFISLWDTQASATNFLGVVASGTSASTGPGPTGNETYWINGTQVAGGTAVQRASLRAALGSGTAKILEVRDIGMAFSAAAFGHYSSFEFDGRLFGLIICPAQNDATRTTIRQYLAGKSGITL